MPCSGCSALHGMNPSLKKESERFDLFNDNVCNNNFCWQEFSSLVYFKSGPFYRISYVGGVEKWCAYLRFFKISGTIRMIWELGNLYEHKNVIILI